MRKTAAGGSPSADRRGRFQRKHLAVVDRSSSSSDRGSVSPRPASSSRLRGGGGGSRRRAVRRRASDRYKPRYSDPKVDPAELASKPAAVGASLNRSKSDASDVTARISRGPTTDWSTGYPRAHETVSLLVTGRPDDRRVILTSSDARSVSSDSTFTGRDKKADRRRAYTMKDRDWHRELVEQYGNPRDPGRDARGDPAQQQSRATNQALSSRYQATGKARDTTRRSTTVVILPTPTPPPPPRTGDSTGAARFASPQPLRKPASVTNLHQPPPVVKEHRPRDSSCPRHGGVQPLGRSAGHGGSSDRLHARGVGSASPARDFSRYAGLVGSEPPGRQEARAGNSGEKIPARRGVGTDRFSRPGSSSEKVSREAARLPCRMAASASPDVRSDRRPTVCVDRPTPAAVSTRSASYRPRPPAAVETARRAADPVCDMPTISWSVTKLRERYGGGGGGGLPATSSTASNNKTSSSSSSAAAAAAAAAALTSTVTTVKVDKNSGGADSKPPQQLSRIAAVQRLL